MRDSERIVDLGQIAVLGQQVKSLQQRIAALEVRADELFRATHEHFLSLDATSIPAVSVMDLLRKLHEYLGIELKYNVQIPASVSYRKKAVVKKS